MKLQFFSRLKYESFICIVLDTKKYRYWYSLSTPFYLKWFPQYLVDDSFGTYYSDLCLIKYNDEKIETVRINYV